MILIPYLKRRIFPDEGRKMKRFIFGVLGTCILAVSISPAAPEPAVVQSLTQWTIDTEYTHPQQIILQNTSSKKPLVFWYMIITITNNTGDDVDFYPKCDLMTDNLQIIPEGEDVPQEVFQQIKLRHKSRYPLLKSISQTDNKLLQSEENSKDIAIIWRDFNNKATNITIFITGLSNETAVVNYPVLKEASSDQPQQAFLRKTLKLKYAVKGDLSSRYGMSVDFKGKKWIMR
jgi:hypothetical protein